MKDYFPLGVGFGKYASWYARIYYSEYYYKYNMDRVYGLEPSNPVFATDTFWPTVFGETGFLGSTIYILLLVYIYSLLLRTIKNNYDYISNIYSLFALLAFIQTICESMGEASFNSPPQNIFVALIIGIALSSSYSKEKTKKEIDI